MSFKQVAILAAKAAGSVHLKYFEKVYTIKSKSVAHDRVTTADLEAEKTVIKLIRKYYPEHNFLAEENKYQKTNSEYTWIIDPLDGTNNFSHNIPIFCVSIALAKKDEVVLGVIYDATRKELFLAEKGKGAFLNGKKIKVSDNKELKDCILITGFPYKRDKKIIETLDNMKKFLFSGTMGISRLGSAALDLCYIACGRADGFFEVFLNPWDFCAGKLIIGEAGGKVTDNKGKDILIDPGYIVASNSKIHKKIIKTIQ